MWIEINSRGFVYCFFFTINTISPKENTTTAKKFENVRFLTLQKNLKCIGISREKLVLNMHIARLINFELLIAQFERAK